MTRRIVRLVIAMWLLVAASDLHSAEAVTSAQCNICWEFCPVPNGPDDPCTGVFGPLCPMPMVMVACGVAPPCPAQMVRIACQEPEPQRGEPWP
jgi:hypothetical protein